MQFFIEIVYHGRLSIREDIGHITNFEKKIKEWQQMGRYHSSGRRSEMFLKEERRLSFGFLLLLADGRVSPANVGVGCGGRPESAFLLGRRDGQVALDVEADGSSWATVGVFSHDQLTQFGFQRFVQGVLVGFELAAVDVVGAGARVFPADQPVGRQRHRLGFLLLAALLLAVQKTSHDRVDLLGDLADLEESEFGNVERLHFESRE